MTANDLELLRRFTRDHAQDAFAELVKRHVNLVFSAALRLVRSPHLAEEIAQSVFADLARNAGRLADAAGGPLVLTAWLYQVTRHTAVDVIRKESRRQLREQIAVELNHMNATAPDGTGVPPVWSDIEPFLDEAMATLDETDRAAVLLRYFENKSLRDVGQTLGTSDDAAQKRVSRAVERLREFFAKRGVTVGASGLAVVISANAVQVAPVGLVVTISTAAALAGTAVTASTLIAATTKTIAMTTLQKTLVTITVAALTGAGIYEARQAAQLRDQVQTLQQQQGSIVEQIQQLQKERDTATNRLAGLLVENSRLKRNQNQTELLKLRGEVTRLRNDAEQANDPIVRKALRWKANVEKMKLLFAEHPEQQVPEIKLLSDNHFFDLAREQDLETSDGIRKAYSVIRSAAKQQFAYLLSQALREFVENNERKLPGSPLDLKPFFQKPVEDGMLDQYVLLFTGKMSDVKGNYVLRDKAVIDSEFDSFWQVGPYAIGQIEGTLGGLMPAIESFTQSNGGAVPTSVSQLKPFITTPELQGAYDKAIKDGVILPPVK